MTSRGYLEQARDSRASFDEDEVAGKRDDNEITICHSLCFLDSQKTGSDVRVQYKEEECHTD